MTTERGTGHRPRGGTASLAAAAAILALLLPASCAHGPSPAPAWPTTEGLASWYGQDFHGKPTSSGRRYTMYGMTAASKTIPLGSKVKVTRLDTGESVVVTVNDRGPFIKGRILDLSYEAARRLDMLGTGVARVRLEVLTLPEGHVVAAVPREQVAATPGERPAAALPVERPATVAAPPPKAAVQPEHPPAGEASAHWISLGIFTLERNAVWLRDKLAAEFPGISVGPLASDENGPWEVRIGPLPGPEETEKSLQRLREMGLKGSARKEGGASGGQ